MRKIIIPVLVGILVVFAVYVFVLHSPPLYLFHARYTAEPGTPLAAFMQNAEVGEVLVTVATNGEISVSGDGDELAQMSYDPSSLRHTVTLVDRYILPVWVRRVADWPPTAAVLWPLRNYAGFTQWFFYHIIPIGGKITIAIPQ